MESLSLTSLIAEQETKEHLFTVYFSRNSCSRLLVFQLNIAAWNITSKFRLKTTVNLSSPMFQWVDWTQLYVGFFSLMVIVAMLMCYKTHLVASRWLTHRKSRWYRLLALGSICWYSSVLVNMTCPCGLGFPKQGD